MVSWRTTETPLVGINFTTIVHFPFLIPRTVVPTNMQYLLPFTMLIRIIPFDRLGIDSDTALAMRTAVVE